MKRKALSALLIAVVTCGCASNVKMTAPTIPVPLVDKIPISVGLRMPDNFDEFVHEESVFGREDWTINLGNANAALFTQLFGHMFDTVTVLQTEDDPKNMGLDALVEPSIDAFEFSTPGQSSTDAFAVWIRYRMKVFDREGKLVFVSGDLDPNGDVRDSHSFYVHNGELPVDRQLFSLQSRFITRNIRGGEREQIVPVPYSLDPLPYTRPETRPFTVLGRPLGARKHKQNIEVGGKRWAKYHIDRSQLTCNGPYHAQVDLVAGMVPINLIHAIQDVGFDFNMSPREVGDGIVDGHMAVNKKVIEFEVEE